MKEEKKINKGFTLIELLLTIAILGLVFTIGYFAISGAINSSREKSKEANEKFIIDASEQYAMEFKNKNSFSKYTNDEEETKFCISLNTLLKYGTYNDNTILKEYANKYVVYVEGKNEVYDYELIKIETANNKCEGVKFISKIADDSDPNKIINIKEKDVNDEDFGLVDITYDFDIIDTGKSNKKYVLSMDLRKYINTEIENITVPVYVVLVLDKSGSMSGTKYTSAKAAAISLSNQLIDKFGSNANVALVQFNSSASIKRNFENEALSESDFDSSGGGTRVANGIDLASKLFSNLKVNMSSDYDKALKYTILLYDGNPSDSISVISSASDTLKGTYDSKLITIGYSFSSSKVELKQISSADSSLCGDSNLTGYCYYESTSSDINTLFSKIQNNISEEVNKTKASKAKIVIKLNSNITVKINEEETNTIEYAIEFGEEEGHEDYKYDLIIKDSIFEGCTSKEECNKEVKLFDNIIIETYNKEGTLLNKTIVEDSPRFVINNSKYSTLQ